MHEAERERLEHNIQDDKAELRRAVRDLGISALIALNLPKRIRRRPLPWAIAGIGIAAFLYARARRRRAQAPWHLRSRSR